MIFTTKIRLRDVPSNFSWICKGRRKLESSLDKANESQSTALWPPGSGWKWNASCEDQLRGPEEERSYLSGNLRPQSSVSRVVEKPPQHLKLFQLNSIKVWRDKTISPTLLISLYPSPHIPHILPIFCNHFVWWWLILPDSSNIQNINLLQRTPRTSSSP